VGQPPNLPENAPGTTCFKTETEARSHPCGPNQNKFIFAKMGQYATGSAPYTWPDGSVSPNTISTDHDFNYVVAFPGGCYGYMNIAAGQGQPQVAYISPTFPVFGPLPAHDMVRDMLLEVHEITIGDGVNDGETKAGSISVSPHSQWGGG